MSPEAQGCCGGGTPTNARKEAVHWTHKLHVMPCSKILYRFLFETARWIQMFKIGGSTPDQKR